MRLAVGHSNDPSTPAAIAEILAELDRKLEGHKPVAGILFASLEVDHACGLGLIMDAYPNLHLVGCTTDGELSSALKFQEDSVALLVFAGDELRAGSGMGKNLSDDPVRAAKAAIGAAAVGDEKPRLCITFPESLTVSAVSVVTALNDALPKGTQLVGGTSGDQWLLERTYQFHGREVCSDSLPVLALYGDFEVGVGVCSGWDPVGDMGTVNRVDGNVVQEIDGAPALDFYVRYFGDQVQPNPEYPLGVFDAERDEFYLRAPLSYNAEEGTVTFAADVPEGSSVQITTAGRDAIVEACERSITAAIAGIHGSEPTGALVVSCAARKQLLGTRTSRESDALERALGEHVPVAGFYSYGEIAPMDGRAVADFHNETFVTILFGSRAA